MEQLKFGDILRNARERKGLGFEDTAQRLRIRPDILRAIEESDIAAMPPRGYARNMVTGYARYLGLDPNEIARLYIDELQLYEDRRARVRARMGETADDTDRNARVSSRAVSRGTQDTGSQARTQSQRASSDNARTARMERYEDDGSSSRSRSSRDTQKSEGGNALQAAAGTISDAASSLLGSRKRPSFNAAGRGRQSRDPMLKANDYVTFYQDSPNPLDGKLPFIAAALILLLILALVLTNCMGRGSKKNEDVATMPVTSVEQSEQQQEVETAPTKFTFAYKFDEGVESWTDVIVDDEVQLSEVVTGPAQGSYDVTGTITFRTAVADGVHVTIDGEEQELEYDDSGMVNMTFNYSDYLKKWQEAHGVKPTSTDSSSSDSSSSDDQASDTASTEDAAATDDTATSDDTAVYDDTATYDDTAVYYDDTATYDETVYY